MGMLSVFVGKVLQLLRESDAADGEKRDISLGASDRPKCTQAQRFALIVLARLTLPC